MSTSLLSPPAPETTDRPAPPAGRDPRRPPARWPGRRFLAVYPSASNGVVEIAAGSPTGSGFVVDAKGHIVTAAHVVDNATSIKVTFADGATRTATLTGKDDATDVAVLKIDPSGLSLHPLKVGGSASLAVGDAVAAIGSPFGYEESLSTGIVSGVDRTIKAPNGFTVPTRSRPTRR